MNKKIIAFIIVCSAIAQADKPAGIIAIETVEGKTYKSPEALAVEEQARSMAYKFKQQVLRGIYYLNDNANYIIDNTFGKLPRDFQIGFNLGFSLSLLLWLIKHELTA